MVKVNDTVTYTENSQNHSSKVTVVHGGSPNPVINLSYTDNGSTQVRTNVVHRDSKPTPQAGHWS